MRGTLIKALILFIFIVNSLSLCYSSCATCTINATIDACITCMSGFYMQGTTCVATCAFYTIASTRVCAMSCPSYSYVNTANNFCEPCPSGCSICLSISTCIKWDPASNPSNLFYDNIELWLILTLLLFFIVAILIWKFCISTKTITDLKEEEVIIPHNEVVAERKIAHTHQST